MMDHEEAYGLIESYAFGTLEADQSLQLETHLESGCEQCLLRLREVSELSVRLAQLVPQVDPPSRIEYNLMEKIRPERKITEVSRLRRIQVPNWVAAAAAVIIVALASGYVILAIQNSKLERRLTEASDVTALLNSPGMQFVDLEGVDPNPQAFGKVVIDPDKGAAVVYMYRLPQTPEGMEYQLWVMHEGKPTSAGVFAVNLDGSAMLALEELDDMGDIGSFLVTIEPTGGQVSPTGMMYLTGPNVFHKDN
jgi:anti-sigma-K factor RskA